MECGVIKNSRPPDASPRRIKCRKSREHSNKEQNHAKRPQNAHDSPGGILAPLASTGVNAAEPTVITLTQTGCQFTEPEGEDHGFKTWGRPTARPSTRKREKAPRRLQNHHAQARQVYFRVTNKNVPYQLGFYLRGAGVGRLTLPKVSGGGLVKGKSRDYHITLKAGDYYYSCPLNPTPDYALKVTN